MPQFFVVGQSVVALGIKAASVETSQADIDPKRTILQVQRIIIAIRIEILWRCIRTWLSKHCVHSSRCTDCDNLGGWSLDNCARSMASSPCFAEQISLASLLRSASPRPYLAQG